MRKLVLEEWISMDGYVADRNGSLDFFTGGNTEENVYADRDQLKFLDRVDTMILGRVTHDLFIEFWPTATTDKEIIADKFNSMDKIVFSSTRSHSSWGKWPSPKFINGDLTTEIKKLKPTWKGHGLMGSISIAQKLMQEDMIDEYHLRLSPVIVGGGRSLFATSGAYRNLKLVDVKKYPTGVVYLHYEPK